MKTSIVIDVIYEKNAAPHYLNSKFDAVSYEGALVESFTEFLKNDSIGDVTGVVSSCVVRSETTKESHRALREPVRWFAEQMERKLRRNDANRGEDGWKDMSIWALLNSANAEIAEFRKAMADVDKWEDAASNMARMGLRVEGGEDALGRVTRDLVEKVVRELADASNYFMMMADILRKKYLTVEDPINWISGDPGGACVSCGGVYYEGKTEDETFCIHDGAVWCYVCLQKEKP